MDQQELAEKVGTLGRTLREQFNLLATGNLEDSEQAAKLMELSRAGRALHDALAAEFNLPEGSNADVLEQIAAAAEARGITTTNDLRMAVAQLKQMQAGLPQGACPTVDAVQDAARNALTLPEQKP